MPSRRSKNKENKAKQQGEEEPDTSKEEAKKQEQQEQQREASPSLQKEGDDAPKEGDDDFEEARERPGMLPSAEEQEERKDEETFEDAQEEPHQIEEDELQKAEDAVNSELDNLAEEAAGAAAASEKEVSELLESKPPDPTLAPPDQSRNDWDDHVINLRSTFEDSSITDEEKIKVLHDALVERIEDTKNLDEHKATTLRRLVEATK